MTEPDPAASTPARVEVGNENGTLVIVISGDLDVVTTGHVRAAIDSALAGGTERVVFEVGGLDFIDSSGVALLASVIRGVQEAELRNPSTIVRRVLALTGLSQVLRIVP